MAEYKKRRSRRKSRVGVQREFFVYDGVRYLGRFTFDDKTRKGKAFDPDRKLIGKFQGYQAGAAAVSAAYKAKQPGGKRAAMGAAKPLELA